MKLKYRLSIIVSTIIILIVTTIATFLLYRAASMQITEARESQTRLAAEQARNIQMQYECYLQIVTTLAGIMADFDNVEAGAQRGRLAQLMESILRSNDELVGIFAVFKPNTIDQGMDEEFIGQIGCTETGQWAGWYTERTGDLQYLTYEAVPEMMAIINSSQARASTIDNPVPQTVAGKATYLLKMTVPVIQRRTNEVVGRVGVNIDIAYVQPIIDKIIKDSTMDEISSLTIYSDNATIVASGIKDQIGKLLTDAQSELYSENTAQAYQAVIHGEARSFSEYSPFIKKDLEIILYPFTIGNTEVNWSLMIGTDRNIILAEVHAMTSFTIIIAVLAIIIAATVIFFVSVRITKPLVEMIATFKYLGEGDLTKTIAINSKDEIGEIAQVFNTTVERIKNLVFTIKKQSIALFDIGNELSTNMTETAAAVNQITANIQSIKGRIMHQSESVAETGATMEQITGNINKLNGQVNVQSASVAQSSSAIEQMLANIQSVTQTLIKNADNVKKLMEASEVGKAGLEEVSSDIKEIARESEGLLEINAVMENIASQTNLLSMNAAIEAAHAGEVGKGFAVVADEIRKLSENSGEQSKTIAAVLTKIKESITKITDSTESVLNKFEAIDIGVRLVSSQEENIISAMEEQGSGSKQILEAIGHLHTATQIVKGSSDEMQVGSKQVIQESHNLSIVTDEITNSMHEMASGADQINSAINKVNTISSQNKESIDVLVREVSRFKVE
ncbi:MAG: methyl-accepting chemotaxis protein [Spirochaetaceae bacterium]|jgi:methyl-accepting chemotaxis protein|nr:methyl-accepting chemotaxis protein [Spirochaetaceae bacterium]